MTRLVYARSSRPGETLTGRPYWWFHYLVIEDGRVTIVETTPALLVGLNYDGVSVQDGDDWSGMTAAQIVEWKHAGGDDRLREVPKDEGERVLAWLDKREVRA